MRVDGRSKAIVVKLSRRLKAAAEVDSLHHAARAHDTQHRVEERIVGHSCSV